MSSMVKPLFPLQCEYEEVLKSVVEGVGGTDKLTKEHLEKLAELKRGIEQKRKHWPILFYAPYESRLTPGRYPQDEFHRSLKKIRLMIGGNRTGKTKGGIADDVMLLLGIHPYIKIPPPVHGWIVSLDFPTSRTIAEEQFWKLVPRSEVVGIDNVNRILTFRNGSTVGFKSCDSDIAKFGGKALHFVHFDEEPQGVRGYNIYTECSMRLLDYHGIMSFTLTPVGGMSWTYDEIFMQAGIDPDIGVVEIQTEENQYIGKDEIDKIASRLSEDEKRMRLYGKYIHFSGLVYPEFDSKTHIVPGFTIPSTWKRYRTIDNGLNNPTACLWIAIDEHDDMYIYDEYYESNKTVKENAEAIKSITAGDQIAWTMIDPASNQRNAETKMSVKQLYRQCGVYCRSIQSDKSAGISMIRQRLRKDDVSGKPKLFVFDHCMSFIKEIQRYRYRDNHSSGADRNPDETPQKVMDHCMDAIRYFVVSNPKYYSDQQKPQVEGWSYGEGE